MQNKRIYLTGVGGQGTLTATTILAQAALRAGLMVVSGEIHGMAQRGGVVESTVLLGGWLSPKLDYGQADVLMGFEPMEALRGLPYLRQGGAVFSSLDALPPPAVSSGQATYPDLNMIKKEISAWAAETCFMSTRSLGREAGAAQSGNIALLGALCASGLLDPLNLATLKETIIQTMKPALAQINLKAADLGAAIFSKG